MYFTTSWDDGHILDNKLVRLLDKYNIKGTFFLCTNFSQEQLSTNDIQNISINHEIGAHTVNHPHLSSLNFDEQYKEIVDSKSWLENILNENCDGFCYPSGNYNNASIRAVEKAGFLYARTVKSHLFEIDKLNVFEVPTSMHIYPYPFRKKNQTHYLWSDLLCPIRNNKNLKKYIGILGLIHISWFAMAKCLFDYALRNDEKVFHLWGHSWEIEKYGLWNELEMFLKYVSASNNIKCLTNKEIVERY